MCVRIVRKNKGGIFKVVHARRFFVGQVCCTEIHVLECDCETGDLKVVRSFSLPLDEVYLWKPRHPLYLVAPSNLFFLKQVRLLCPSGVECDLAVRFEYDKNVPFPIHAVYWGYDLLDPFSEEIEKSALIVGCRADVMDKWLEKLGSPIANAVGLTPYVVPFYNLFRQLELTRSLREPGKVTIGLLCDTTSTDMVIIGESPQSDWLRSFARTYGNVSLIWDVKETLESYFARTGPVVGNVPLTKEISDVFMIRSGQLELEKEWENLFAEQVGVQIKEFPVGEVVSDYLPAEKAMRFILPFGLAMALAGEKFPVVRAMCLRDVEVSYKMSARELALQSVLILSLLGIGGFLGAKSLLPLQLEYKRMEGLLEDYKKAKKVVARLEKKKERLKEEFDKAVDFVSVQYRWPGTMVALSRAIDDLDDVRIEALSGKFVQYPEIGLSFTLKVTGKNYSVLNEFLTNLRQERFKKVSPVSSRYDQSKGQVEMILILEE